MYRTHLLIYGVAAKALVYWSATFQTYIRNYKLLLLYSLATEISSEEIIGRAAIAIFANSKIDSFDR